MLFPWRDHGTLNTKPSYNYFSCCINETSGQFPVTSLVSHWLWGPDPAKPTMSFPTTRVHLSFPTRSAAFTVYHRRTKSRLQLCRAVPEGGPSQESGNPGPTSAPYLLTLCCYLSALLLSFLITKTICLLPQRHSYFWGVHWNISHDIIF